MLAAASEFCSISCELYDWRLVKHRAVLLCCTHGDQHFCHCADVCFAVRKNKMFFVFVFYSMSYRSSTIIHSKVTDGNNEKMQNTFSRDVSLLNDGRYDSWCSYTRGD